MLTEKVNNMVKNAVFENGILEMILRCCFFGRRKRSIPIRVIDRGYSIPRIPLNGYNTVRTCPIIIFLDIVPLERLSLELFL